TSPTNIGLLFLTTSAAHDLGYVSSLEFVERQELTFATVAKLKKFQGHLFNWYDTRTLEPLQPQYISTVDSGNLAGHLIAVKQACIELPDTKLFDERIIAGLRDTVDAISFEATKLGSVRQRTDVVTVSQLRDEIEACRVLLGNGDSLDLEGWQSLFKALGRHIAEIEDIINALAHEHGADNFKELRWWIAALDHQVGACRRDADTLTGWTDFISQLPSETTTALADENDGTKSLASLLKEVPTLASVPELCDSALVELAAMNSNNATAETSGLVKALERTAAVAGDVLSRLSRLAANCDQVIEDMDFKFLLDPERKVFTIGYNVSAQRADNSFYDLLASEARLASFVAIAKGDVSQEHWFRMGRQLTSVDGGRALISWTGTMFEYLMPLLVMRNYSGT